MSNSEQIANSLINFVRLMENEEEAKEFVRVFLEARPDINKDEIIKIISKADVRFCGYEALKILEYNYTDVSGDSLYLKRPIANEIKDKKYKIKLMLFLEE